MLDIRGKNIAVLCDTEEKIREFYEAINCKVDKEIFKCNYPSKLYIGFYEGDLAWDSCNYFSRNDYKLITFDEFIKEDNKVNKFKVGDIVKIIRNSNHHGFKIGENVKLTETYTTDCIDYYSNGIGFYANRLDGTTITCNIIRDCDMELIEVKKSKTITITTSDTTTTLTDGTHTTTINRYYTDKHDERVAIDYVVKKYYDELNEIDRVSKMPKVGDKVKVVDNGKTHSTYDEWLIKNNVNLKSAIKWRSGLFPENGGEYIIKEIHKYEYYDTDLALIEDGENAYIINIKGLEVIK